MGSWFSKCLPKIKDIKSNLSYIAKDLNKIKGVKGLYLWGSVCENFNNPEYRVKDIDILARTNFNSGDLLSIDNDILTSNFDDNSLENKGYDPYSIYFSKKFIEISEYNIDKWAISSDRKLLHWGPILENKNDTDYIIKEAEEFANVSTGLSFQKIQKRGDEERKLWHDYYKKYLDSYFKDMPSGWYKTDTIKIKEILKNTIKL